jgi:hypothetical protein
MRSYFTYMPFLAKDFYSCYLAQRKGNPTSTVTKQDRLLYLFQARAEFKISKKRNEENLMLQQTIKLGTQTEGTGGSRIKKSACFLKYSRISSSLTVPFSPPVPEGKAKLCGVPSKQSKMLKTKKNYKNL